MNLTSRFSMPLSINMFKKWVRGIIKYAKIANAEVNTFIYFIQLEDLQVMEDT